MINSSIFIPRKVEGRKEQYIQKLISLGLFKQKHIDGNLDLSHLPIKTLDEIEEINGHLLLRDSGIENLGNLKKVNGCVWLYNCKKLKSLGKLEYIDGWLDLSDSGIKNLNNLKYISSDIYLQNCKHLKHLSENIQMINGLIYLSENHKIPKEEIEKYKIRTITSLKYN